MEQKTFNKAKILDERIIAIGKALHAIGKALQDIETMPKQTMLRIILIGAFDDRAVRIELGEKQNQILADDIKDYIIRRLEKEKDALEIELKKLSMKNLSYPQPFHDNLQKQAAFFNACDYLYYGYGKTTWIKNEHNLGLSEKDSNEVWHEAFVYMSNQN